MRESASSTLRAIPALLTPVILLGGIYTGVMTPTEAGAVAALYAIFISGLIYRSINPKILWSILKNTAKTTGSVGLIVMAAYGFSHIVAAEHIPEIVGNAVTALTDNKNLFYLMINVVLLMLGCVFDSNTIQLVFLPTVLGTAMALGIDPVHFGVITSMNIIIGQCTPPFGVLLFITSGVSGTPLKGMYAMYDEPRLLHALMEKGVSLSVRQAEYLLDRGIKILRYNDSVANMNVISPESWREFVFPHIKRFCDEVHSIDHGAIIYCHICGNIMPIVDDLIATGLDCIAPLDPLGGVSAAKIRERVGSQFVLMGGVDTLSFIQRTPAEVKAEAIKVIREGLSPAGGRFIVGSGCVVPRGAPVETIRALREASEELAKEE